MNLSINYQCAAEVLMAAVSQLCPKAYPIEGRATRLGFAYDFCFPYPFSNEMFPFIEERMSSIIREDHPIEHRQMIPENAAAFFKYHQRYYPSILAKGSQKSLLDIFIMDQFIDLCPPPYLKRSQEIGQVKLLKLSSRPPISFQGKEREVMRIEGTIFLDSQSKKKILKRRKELEALEHRKFGEQRALFWILIKRKKHLRERHQVYWFLEGKKLIRKLLHFLEDRLLDQGYFLVKSGGGSLLENHERFLISRQISFKEKPFRIAEIGEVLSDDGIDPWEGFYCAKNYMFERFHIFCLKKHLANELISSLQFIEKTLRMFDFNGSVQIFFPKNDQEISEIFGKIVSFFHLEVEKKKGKKGKMIWKIEDRYGRLNEGPFLEVENRKDRAVVIGSLFGQIEKWIALLIEAKGISFDERMKGVAKKTAF